LGKEREGLWRGKKGEDMEGEAGSSPSRERRGRRGIIAGKK
jgi:hypothetical protein